YYLEKSVTPLKSDQWNDEDGTPLVIGRDHIMGSRSEGEPDLHDLQRNFVFASEDPSVSRQLLSSGTNPENYSIQERSGKYHVLFHPSHSVYATEVHHANSRIEAENAVASLVRYFRNMLQSVEQCYAGERMHVVEHILLRPQQQSSQCYLHVCDRTSRTRLRSAPVAKEKKEDHLDLIFRHGQDAASYRIHTHESGKYYVAIHAHGQPIATGTQFFHTTEEAATEIRELIELLRLLHLEPEMREEHIHPPTDDFYSQRISVLLPDWPMRFQSNEFRLYAEQLLHENAPAHLAIDCFWLSLHEMKEFEQLYGQWKSLKRAVHAAKTTEQDSSGQVQALDKASARMREIIETLENRQRNMRPRSEDDAKADRK
ncbi:MAG TPA: hypothetical protein VE133_17100, partial [Candidatus Sulfotelmatobacter sp.]|nr:hypothetical protein [Candidatus Sulfotelmatobacter sp.]